MEEIKEAPKAIDWPRVQIGEDTLVLRYSYASNYQLARWGKTIQSASNIELGAAMCGKFDTKGKWRSSAFTNPVELADLISELDANKQGSTETALLEGITAALKKAFPALEVAQTPAQNGVIAAKTDSWSSGPSQLREAV